MIKRKSPKAREPNVEGHPTKWSVVVFHGAGLGTIGLYAKRRILVGLYDTKLEADAATTKVKDGVRPATAQRLGPEWSRSDADQIARWYVGRSKDIVLTDERKRLNMPAKALPDLDQRSPSDEEIRRVLLDL
jgi:hypothetical protein